MEEEGLEEIELLGKMMAVLYQSAELSWGFHPISRLIT